MIEKNEQMTKIVITDEHKNLLRKVARRYKHPGIPSPTKENYELTFAQEDILKNALKEYPDNLQGLENYLDNYYANRLEDIKEDEDELKEMHKK